MSPEVDTPSSLWRPTGLLAPLVPAYAAVVAARNAGYRHGWLATRHLQAPVISVGGLSVGGAGKTPLVICLARLLAARGLLVDVLSRGYGRRSGMTEQVDLHPSGAARFGDEPLLIAQATGVPVYVGAGRYAAGLLAEQQQPATPALRVHLLDDGFQHRQLARAADIVVLHRTDFGEWLLPAGRLREPLSSLQRATAIVLRSEDADLQHELRRRGFREPVWLVSRSLAVPAAAFAERALAFCGIARPDDFFSALRSAGVELAATHAFQDHHAFGDADIASLVASARARGATVLLTTEKDLVRLSSKVREALQQGARLLAVPLEVHLQDEESVLTTLLRQLDLPTSGDAIAG